MLRSSRAVKEEVKRKSRRSENHDAPVLIRKLEHENERSSGAWLLKSSNVLAKVCREGGVQSR